jgi:tRNA pseudouridine38-40 synthase
MTPRRNIKILVAYDGTRWHGWQKLGDTDKTIQGKLEEILSRICGEPVEVTGSGRTDAGVHALGQCANFLTRSVIPAGAILEQANRYLPGDISVLEAADTGERFHSRYKALSKTYLYRIFNSPVPDPFLNRYSWHIEKELDIRAMEKGAGHLVGKHDFQSFTSLKPGKKSTERTISSLKTGLAPDNPRLLEIRISADGFLYNMVRLAVGTLVETGLGHLAPDEVAEILDKKQRSLAGPMAPPQGLFLESVIYSDH